MSHAVRHSVILAVVTLITASRLQAQVPSGPVSSIQMVSTGVFGLTSGEAAQLNVLNPGDSALLLGILCSGDIALADDQNALLAFMQAPLFGGRAVSLTVNADTGIRPQNNGRVRVRGVVRTKRQ